MWRSGGGAGGVCVVYELRVERLLGLIMNQRFILGTHPLLMAGLVVWMGVGWWASQATLNDLQSLAQFGGLPEGQREEITFGTDYAGYQYLLGASKPQDVILAVVPDGLYGNKLIYFYIFCPIPAQTLVGSFAKNIANIEVFHAKKTAF